ncbi:MAG TPA: Spy/CpxP family protein refolding chaperone [Acidocella sp.]|uniref:Spy/CpxP family protein refolding chaperone n=1 Tax=Acidocella sp. TaxID=50710 RepID=UPI002C59A8A7|nr:Spy/CpxP family protein refolding chaperone [Acidocella sp.]HVE20458.1 Spy/CpxP family protein refolding chaperone [Acidocella sp.]
MSRVSMSRWVVVLAAMLVLPTEIFAQQARPSAADPAKASNSVYSPPGVAPVPKMISEEVEQYIEQVHDQLGISASEQPQWNQFAQVMRDNALRTEEAFAARGASVATMNAAANMDSYAQLAQLHAENMQKLATAFQSLYDTFPLQQRKVVDAIFWHSSRSPTPHG